MEFGIFSNGYVPGPAAHDSESEHTALMREIELAIHADRHNWKYVWFGEHHALTEYSHLSAPEVVIGYVAHATEQIHMGTAIMNISPRVNHPVRSAERAVDASSVALFRLGEMCNNKCPMCSNTGRPAAFFIEEEELLRRVTFLQQQGFSRVVLTGGEPLLQVDDALLQALHAAGFRVAVETNGSLPAPPGLDWICVSPKAGAPFVQRSGQELKLVFPQPALIPDALPHTQFEHYLLQPMDGPERERNTELAVAWCLAHPRWALSLQTHKLIGID